MQHFNNKGPALCDEDVGQSCSQLAQRLRTRAMEGAVSGSAWSWKRGDAGGTHPDHVPQVVHIGVAGEGRGHVAVEAGAGNDGTVSSGVVLTHFQIQRNTPQQDVDLWARQKAPDGSGRDDRVAGELHLHKLCAVQRLDGCSR